VSNPVINRPAATARFAETVAIPNARGVNT